MIRVSDRIVDVPCEINSLRWDKVCLVQQTVMSYLAILCLMIRASRRLSFGFWLMDSKGPDYMSGAGSVSRAGVVCRDDLEPGIA